MDATHVHSDRSSARAVAPWHLLIMALLIAIQIAGLVAMGKPWICNCGHVAVWYPNATGPETSQHIADWYTYSHVLHGLGFYFLLWLIAPRAPLGLRLVAAVGLEVGWELLENTPMIIERYRQGGLAQGYFGDSIVNSVSDTIAAIFGFFIAAVLPVWLSIALVIACEAFLAYTIRDNLLLNIIQLIHPSEALTRWQSGK
ncbi:MAG: DUF2585 family protein [Hyphomicrobiaceae bacterium]